MGQSKKVRDVERHEGKKERKQAEDSSMRTRGQGTWSRLLHYGRNADASTATGTAFSLAIVPLLSPTPLDLLPPDLLSPDFLSASLKTKRAIA